MQLLTSPAGATRDRRGKKTTSFASFFRAYLLRLPSKKHTKDDDYDLEYTRMSNYKAIPSAGDVAVDIADSPVVPVSEKQAAELVDELRRVFRGGMTKSLEWRAEQLNGLLRFFAEREKEIFAALAQDLGRNWQESFMEINTTVKAIKHLRKNFRSWAKPRTVSTPLALQPASSQVVSEPFGVVLVLGAWNYPFNVLLEPVAGAIAAGNAVVMKPAELAPATSACIAKWLPRYVDSEGVRVVAGGVDTSKALLEQRWDKIFYTGGSAVGKIVMAAAAKHLTPVSLELGGKNPLYLDDTVDLKTAARRIIQGRCINSGQTCIAPEYILAHEAVVSRLVDVLKETITEFYGEDPSRSPDFARIISDGHFQRVTRLLAEPAVASCIAHGGQTDEASKYVAPTLLVNVPWDATLMKEECFSPLLTIQTVRSVQEAIDTVNEREKPLVLHVFSNDNAVFQQFSKETSSGALLRNDCILHFSNPHLPFGGVGMSGMSRYHGKYSFDCCSHEKAVFHKWLAADLPNLRYPPRTLKKDRIFSGLINNKVVDITLLLLGIRK